MFSTDRVITDQEEEDAAAEEHRGPPEQDTGRTDTPPTAPTAREQASTTSDSDEIDEAAAHPPEQDVSGSGALTMTRGHSGFQPGAECCEEGPTHNAHLARVTHSDNGPPISSTGGVKGRKGADDDLHGQSSSMRAIPREGLGPKTQRGNTCSVQEMAQNDHSSTSCWEVNRRMSDPPSQDPIRRANSGVEAKHPTAEEPPKGSP